ncbi:MAG: hypothetical protein AAFU85_09810 [Planctomycetota bacterium]
MKLLFCDTDVGTITDAGHDGPEVWASYVPNSNAEPLQEMWKFITDEDNFDKDPPFPDEYLDDESWSIEQEDGQRRSIYLPAVYEDGAISWRWRG